MCGNALTVARTASTDKWPEGRNAFQCRTCPFQFPIRKDGWSEYRHTKGKGTDDVLRGEDELKKMDRNDDSMYGLVHSIERIIS